MAPQRKAAPLPVPDLPAMASSIAGFLRAAGLDPAKNADLAQTPELVAKAWAEEFLDGYQAEPKRILADRFPAPPNARGEMVVVTGIDFQSVCPHHLLPYGGVAHVAYVPGKHVVGFGQLVRLLDCFGHRLVLQEDLARQVAESLVDELGASSAGVVLVGHQACLALRGERRSRAKVFSEAFAGRMADDAELRSRFLSRIDRERAP